MEKRKESPGPHVPEPERVTAEFLESLPGGVSGKRLLAALSGGADSVALVAVLSALSPRLGFTLEAVTVQHGMRTDGSSEADADFALSLCASLSPPVPCVRIDLEPGALDREAGRRGGGPEDAARHLRYAALRRRAGETGADWSLTGHTRNDFLETVLMRFIQGSSGSSLAGIRPVAGNVARPLLGLGKTDLVGYLRDRGLSWREDPTNADPRYLRNRVRASLVPLLESEFPGWARGVAAAAERAALDESFCRLALDFSWVSEGGRLRGDRSRFEGLHPALAHRALRDGLNALGVGRRIPFPFLRRVVAERESALLCGAGLRFERAGDTVFFGPDIVHFRKSGYLVYIASTGFFDLPFGKVEVTGSAEAAFIGGNFGPWPLPLALRSRLPGDLADGKNGAALKKIYNEWAVPESLRDRIPLVELDGELRAAYGKPFGYPDLTF